MNVTLQSALGHRLPPPHPAYGQAFDSAVEHQEIVAAFAGARLQEYHGCLPWLRLAVLRAPTVAPQPTDAGFDLGCASSCPDLLRSSLPGWKLQGRFEDAVDLFLWRCGSPLA